MIYDTVRAKSMKLIDTLLSVPDEIGLCEICSDPKYYLHIPDEDEIKRITLDAVREAATRFLALLRPAA